MTPVKNLPSKSTDEDQVQAMNASGTSKIPCSCRAFPRRECSALSEAQQVWWAIRATQSQQILAAGVFSYELKQ